MALVSEDDIQVHLPVDKLLLDNVPDDVASVQLDAERVIKGRLSGIFSATTLAAWASPATTPEYIRGIGGRLAAALLYRLRLSQDDPDDPEYAQNKYLEAMSMLELVAAGAVTLPEITEEINTGARLSTNHFTALPNPKFTMDAEY